MRGKTILFQGERENTSASLALHMHPVRRRRPAADDDPQPPLHPPPSLFLFSLSIHPLASQARVYEERGLRQNKMI